MMTSKLFWVLVLSAAICAGVLYWQPAMWWVFLRQAEARWDVVAEDVPFVDREGRTPTVEELVDRVIKRYTKCEYLSFDVETYMYIQSWQSHTRYLAAADKAKRVIRVRSLTPLGRNAEKFTLTLRTLPDLVSEECVLAKDGTRLATSYTPDDHPTFRLSDRIPGYFCGMDHGGLFYSTIHNPDRGFITADRTWALENKIIGTVLVGSQRCAVTYHYGGREIIHVISPDYYILQENAYQDGELARVKRYSNFSNAPIPDEEFE